MPPGAVRLRTLCCRERDVAPTGVSSQNLEGPMVNRRFKTKTSVLEGLPTARRVAVKRLAQLVAGVVATGVASIDPDGAEAKRKRRCRHGKRRCGKKCRNVQSDAANCGACGNRCGSGEGCYEGLCLTAAGTCAAIITPCISSPFCNGSAGSAVCNCYQSAAGETRCAGIPATGARCGDCSEDAQCSALFGPGAFCSLCCGQCFIPCPV